MAYSRTSPSSRHYKSVPPPPRSTPAPPSSPGNGKPGYDVADEPSRLSKRTLIVVAVSVLATGISLYRIRDTFKQDTPQPSPYQEFMKSNPEYADLIMAMRERDVHRAEEILAKNPWLANFSKPEAMMSPPLLLAAVSNQPDMVDLLIDRGADVNAKGRFGGTALHWAAWRGSADAVDELVHRGANLEAKSDNDASTPLFWACRGSREAFWSRNNHPATIQILLDSGAKPDVSNSDGFSAVSIASDDVAKLLVQHGATAQAPATQPTYGTMPAGERPWGFGFGMHRFGRTHDGDADRSSQGQGDAQNQSQSQAPGQGDSQSH